MRFTQAFDGTRENLSPMRSWIKDHCASCPSAKDLDLTSIIFASGEILQNVIRHGFERNDISGQIRIEIFDLDCGLVIDVLDDSVPSDPDQWVADKPIEEGGIGLFSLKNAVSSVRFEERAAGNFARLSFFDPSFTGSDKRASWMADILTQRQLPNDLEYQTLLAVGKDLTPEIERGISQCCRAVLSDIESKREHLQYHSDYHIQDVVISLRYLLDEAEVSAAKERLVMILAGLFHDFLHPGVKHLGDLDEPIEMVSAREAARVIADAFEGEVDETDRSIISKLIESTEPSNLRSLTRSFGTGSVNLFQYQAALLNDADVAASQIRALGLELAYSLVEEQGAFDVKIESMYETFLRSRPLQTPEAKLIFGISIREDL